MRAADVMSSAVVTTRAAAPLAEAIDLMVSRRVSGLPVLDDSGTVVGMVTESDLLDRAELGVEGRSQSLWSAFTHTRDALAFTQLHGRFVSDVMTHGIVSVTLDLALSDVARILRERDIRAVPVLEQGRIRGMISRLDLMRVVGSALAAHKAPLDDGEIEARLRDELRQSRWAPRDIAVTARDGVVSLSGVVRDEPDIAALAAMAKNVPGVREVQTKALFLLSPGTGYSRPEDISG